RKVSTALVNTERRDAAHSEAADGGVEARVERGGTCAGPAIGRHESADAGASRYERMGNGDRSSRGGARGQRGPLGAAATTQRRPTTAHRAAARAIARRERASRTRSH